MERKHIEKLTKKELVEVAIILGDYLEELRDYVWHEAGHILDEDRGGNAELDVDIDFFIRKLGNDFNKCYSCKFRQGTKCDKKIHIQSMNDWCSQYKIRI